MSHGYDRETIGKRLRRIEGQVRGIEKMVADDERPHAVTDVASGDEAAARGEDGRAPRGRAAVREGR